MAKLINGTRVVTNEIRASYVHVAEPVSVNGSDPKYSMSVIISKDDKEYTNLLEKSVAHYNIVLDNAKENKLINRALGGKVLALCMLNRKDEAKQYAQRIENDTERNDALCWCLDGEEKIRHCQTVSEEHLSRFLFQLTYYPKTIEA